MKFNHGWVENKKTGQRTDIVVKSAMPNKVKDLLIGVALVGAGILYLTRTAFCHGIKCYENAELEALTSEDLIK